MNSETQILPLSAAEAAAAKSDVPAHPTFRTLAGGDILAWSLIWRRGAAGVSVRGALQLIWTHPGLRATLWFRVSHALWRSHVPALPGMVSRLNLMLHGLDIPASVEIGPGLYIPHPVGTAIMAKRIGARVSLIHGITIGMRATPAFPELGDDVFVGAGARILGGIVIGAGANIGANAVVLKDVPPGATAVGVPARILAKKNSEAKTNSEESADAQVS